eukprot:350941-Chlamydomonas_euryale.AAC.14
MERSRFAREMSRGLGRPLEAPPALRPGGIAGGDVDEGYMSAPGFDAHTRAQASLHGARRCDFAEV